MVSVKRATLVRAAAKPARPVQTVPPHSAAPQPNNNQVSYYYFMFFIFIFARKYGRIFEHCVLSNVTLRRGMSC